MIVSRIDRALHYAFDAGTPSPDDINVLWAAGFLGLNECGQAEYRRLKAREANAARARYGAPSPERPPETDDERAARRTDVERRVAFWRERDDERKEFERLQAKFGQDTKP